MSKEKRVEALKRDSLKQESSKQECKIHYNSLDWLRVLSAIGIILMHVRANSGYHIDGFVYNRLIPSFTDLVFLFMVISGFSMCCGYYDKLRQHQISYEEFYGKRYKKTWPYFALLCLLDLVVSPSITALYEVFANLTLCFGLLPNAAISVIGVGWFLGVVFVFYLLFPFFCYLLSNKGRAWLAMGAALIFNILCQIYFLDAEHVTEQFQPRASFVYCAVFFLAGGMIFLYREQLGKIAGKYQWILLFLLLGTIAGYYILGSFVSLMLLAFSLLLIWALNCNWGGYLQKTIKFLSGITMEIYLCHMIIYRVIEKSGLCHFFKSDVISYILTSAGTLMGAVISRKVMAFIGKRMLSARAFPLHVKER